MSRQLLREETLRYLGIPKGSADEAMMRTVEESIAQIEATSNKQYVAKQANCRVEENGVWLDSHFVCSKQLASHLQGCTSAYVFACTLGIGVDRLLQRSALLRPSLAVIEQAAAAAVVEQFCDEIGEKLEALVSDGGRYHLRPRFSAGYGDMALEEQRFLLEYSDATKRIGLTYTAGYMLSPTKSVTAVIGISEGTARCYAKGCAMCAKTDCAFRKQL